ncbi:vWA domain-containing protein [Oceanobacillus sp. CAU 1775]
MNKKVTEIIFLLDKSGSMWGLEEDTIGGFNALMKKQAQLDGATRATVALFDHEYEVIWEDVSASELNLTSNEYFIGGSTALLDAIGKTIVNYSNNRLREKTTQVIFVITTDGLENASCEFSYKKVKELIRQMEKEYNWEFIFLGANIDAIEEAVQLGINIKDAYNFDATSDGVEEMYGVIHESLLEKREN